MIVLSRTAKGLRDLRDDSCRPTLKRLGCLQALFESVRLLVTIDRDDLPTAAPSMQFA